MSTVSAWWRVVAASALLMVTLSGCDVPALGLSTDEQPAPSATAFPVQPGDPRVAVYMGWGETEAVDRFASWLGRPVWAHDFLDHRQGWDAVADPQQLSAWEDWAAEDEDRRLVLSVPLLIDATAGDFAGGANGAYDQHFTQLAESLVAHGLEDTIIRLGWEFNGNTFPWAVSSEQVQDYQRFWRRVVTAMRTVDGAEFLFDWCPNITRDATGLSFEEMYPGDDVVDVVGLGFYDYYWGHPVASPEPRWEWLRDVHNGLADHREFAAEHGKPRSFPEYGLWPQGSQVGGGGDDPYFIERFAEWVDSEDVLYHGYNNVRATVDHRLTSYPEARHAYLEAFGR